MYYHKKGDIALCYLCPHRCNIRPGQRGICYVRENISGKLYTRNYGEISVYNLDPIEKKPLYHFYPGTRILSVGSFGCNLKCSFCQNYTIAHGIPRTVDILPGVLVDRAKKEEGNMGIAYTYNEPFIWYEYVLETARAARQAGLKNVLVTNGYISEEPLKELLPFIDAVNIDVKAFGEGFYRNTCSGRLKPVLETVERCAGNCHVELTTLVIGGLNDNFSELEEMGRWLESLDRGIPLHLSRYYPAYKMDRPPTPVEVLLEARELMQKYLDYVYIGNVAGVDNSTYCPDCGAKLVERNWYRVRVLADSEECTKCGKKIDIVL